MKTHAVRHSCKMKSCPNCWEKWIQNATNTIKFRLSDKKIREKNQGKRLLHIVVSPSGELVEAWKNEELTEKELRDKAIGYLYKKSVKPPTGTVVFHAYRFNDKGEKGYKAYIAKCKDNGVNNKDIMKKWQWIREKHGDDWRRYTRFSPHYHYIGYVGWLDKPKQGENFVYKTITDKNGKVKTLNDRKTMHIQQQQLHRAIFYILTHTVDRTDRDYYRSYVHLGDISTRNGKPELQERIEEKQQELKQVNRTCRACRDGKLFYIRQNLTAFLRAWLDIQNPHKWSDKSLKRGILQAKDIPREIKKNVLEGMDMLQDYHDGEPPPEDYPYILENF